MGIQDLLPSVAMVSKVLKACSPLLLLSVVISGCSNAPSLMRLDCSDSLVQRFLVFDRQTGQLYNFFERDDVYQPQPVDRFRVKTQGRIKGNRFVLETRVGDWIKVGLHKSVLKPLKPAVGSDFTVDLTTLQSTYTPLIMKDGKPVSEPKSGQCKSLPLATHSGVVHTLHRAQEVR